MEADREEEGAEEVDEVRRDDQLGRNQVQRHRLRTGERIHCFEKARVFISGCQATNWEVVVLTYFEAFGVGSSPTYGNKIQIALPRTQAARSSAWPQPGTATPSAWGGRVQASGSRVQGPGFRVQGPGSRAQGPGSKVQDSGSRVQDPESRVQGPGSRVQGPGSRVQGPGSRVQGSQIGDINCVAEFRATLVGLGPNELRS